MASPSTTSTPWSAVPAELRTPVVGGLRWTVWLAFAGVPFGYATRVILARLGREPLAIYGLLLVYAGYVAGILFLGGNAVAIRYVPTLDTGRRNDFLFSYFLLILLNCLPWLAAAWAWPGLMRSLFGGIGGRGFQLTMLGLAPLLILFSLLLAALKGALDLTWAQWIYRGLTLGLFLGYLVLALHFRAALLARTAWWLWGWYLVLTGVGCAVAFTRWHTLCPRWRRPRWFLPAGFWSYTLGLQGVSMLGFVATQIDLLLVVHAGGVLQLGDYVAIMTLVATATAALTLLLDGLMAALTHAAARGDAALAGQLWNAYSRFLLPLILLLDTGLAFLAHPLLAIYGHGYLPLQTALCCLAPLAALDGVNCLLGSTLSALGRPRPEIWAKGVRIAVYLVLFPVAWHALGLLGAVLAWGAAEIPYQAVHLFFLRRIAPFALGWGRLYPAFLLALALTALLSLLLRPASVGFGLLFWAGILLLFLFLAGYTPGELRAQMRLLLP